MGEEGVEGEFWAGVLWGFGGGGLEAEPGGQGEEGRRGAAGFGGVGGGGGQAIEVVDGTLGGRGEFELETELGEGDMGVEGVLDFGSCKERREVGGAERPGAGFGIDDRGQERPIGL